jgi:ADP-ribose pyrophosphatase YjhB (NUDIX family)
MPTIVSDLVDAYVFRRMHARLQFLLLLRRPDAPLGNTWQAVHETIDPAETAFEAASRAVLDATGLAPAEAFSADYVNQVYDHTRDAIVLAPVFAFACARAQSPPRASATTLVRAGGGDRALSGPASGGRPAHHEVIGLGGPTRSSTG